MKEFLKRTIVPVAGKLFFARPANRKSFDQLRTNLEASSKNIKDRIAVLDDAIEDKQPDEKITEKLRHIIAIECWGQSRLMVFLGDSFKQDENYPYLPDEALSWTELKENFAETRAKTIEITRRLEAQSGIESEQVKHNDFGPFTAKAWLQYLVMHGNNEARSLKARSTKAGAIKA